MILFLDFDGVLRRVSSPPAVFDADCLECFECAVRKLETCEIVIASSWRETNSLAELRARFSADIALRISGSVPFITSPADFPRHREALEYLEADGLGAKRWVAIDDDPRAYPEGCPVILTDPARGFDETAARKLIEMANGS